MAPLIVAREGQSWGHLRPRGWQLDVERGHRLWRLNGLSLPTVSAAPQGTRRCRNDVWAWDFVRDRYNDKEQLRCLTVKDEATGYCLAIKTSSHLQHKNVKAVLKESITYFGLPKAIRSDNGSNLLAGPLREETKTKASN